MGGSELEILDGGFEVSRTGFGSFDAWDLTSEVLADGFGAGGEGKFEDKWLRHIDDDLARHIDGESGCGLEMLEAGPDVIGR